MIQNIVQYDISFRVDIRRTNKFFNNPAHLLSSDLIFFFKIITQIK